MTDLTDLHDDLRSVARDLLGVGAPGWDQVAALGWLGLEVPEELGGAGATFAETAVVLEELGRAATTSAYLGSAVLGVGALLALAPGAHRNELLRAVAAGERRLAVALAPSGDLPLAEAAFQLVRSGDDLVLTGEAAFVADAGEADELLVLASLDAELALVHLPAAALEIVDQPVLDATRRFATVTADGHPVASASVGSISLEVAQRVLDRGAVAVALDSLGLAAAMLATTVAYVSERKQFGRAVGSFQAVKHQCADVLVQLTIGRELVALAIGALVDDASDPTLAVARAASFASQVGVDATGTAMQLHGGIGYSWESGIHVYLKRATLDRSLFGSPPAQRRRISARLAPA